jgi:hypothetical protein
MNLLDYLVAQRIQMFPERVDIGDDELRHPEPIFRPTRVLDHIFGAR